MKEHLIDLSIQIQQVGSPTFFENERAQFVKKLFQQHSDVLQEIDIDPTGNVYACFKGKSSEQPLVISAHLDTVFPIETPLDVKIEGSKIFGPGLGDNSISVASLIVLVEVLKAQKSELSRDIWLVANTCEEGLGDLAGIKAVVSRFGSAPVLYLILEGLGHNRLIHKAIGVKRYRITATSKGGHSWADFGIPSAIHEMSKLVTEISKLQLPEKPKTTFNVGRFIGGTSINTIAAEATIELDMRSESQLELNKLIEKVDQVIAEFNLRRECFEVRTIGERPSGLLPEDHPLLKMASDCLTANGTSPIFTAGSTDANVPLSKGYPSFVMGITQGGSTHTVNEYILTDFIETGFSNFVTVVKKIAQ